MAEMDVRQSASQRALREMMAGAGIATSDWIMDDQSNKLNAHWYGQQQDAELAKSQAMNNENIRAGTQRVMEDDAYRADIETATNTFLKELKADADAEGDKLNEKFSAWARAQIEKMLSMNADPSWIKQQYTEMQRFWREETPYHLFVDRDASTGSYEEGEFSYI